MSIYVIAIIVAYFLVMLIKEITRKPLEEIHYHKDIQGHLVSCYHACKSLLSSWEFWIGMTLSFPFEHFLWEKVYPFNVLTHLLGL